MRGFAGAWWCCGLGAHATGFCVCPTLEWHLACRSIFSSACSSRTRPSLVRWRRARLLRCRKRAPCWGAQRRLHRRPTLSRLQPARRVGVWVLVAAATRALAAPSCVHGSRMHGAGRCVCLGVT